MENIIQIDFTEEMRNSYRDYAMSVIMSRALPDVRDGLKPVQRRILYAMNELALAPDKPHRKSARIVGDTMGKYHPHGDSSIYDALVHMTEDYSLSIPLVDGHGNYGSIDGDGAAAMRYTEARLSYGAQTLLEHLDDHLVEFVPNFDESEKEPSVLPALIPNLLINGTSGIAVGMATNIPPHNASEVIDGVIAYMDRPSISTEKLMEYIPGPDFPTGGMIINQEDLLSIYETGEGKLKIRGTVEIEKGDNGRQNIIISEIPFTIAGNKTKLVEHLSSLMKEKVFDEIYDVRDESSKEGIRIVIEIKKDRNIPNLLNGLYKKTALEDTYSVNLLAVKEQQPITFNLKSLIQEFVSFQEELYTKEYRHLLEKAKHRLEIVNGLVRATDLIDLIIEILRGSQSVKQAKDCLIHGNTEGITFRSKQSETIAKTLDFTEVQADAILSMQLSKLIGLEIMKLHQEADTLNENISQYELVLSSTKELHKVIKGRLREFKKRFARPRRTKLSTVEKENYVEEIKEEDMYVLVDRFGYVKTIDTATYSRTSEDVLKEYPHIITMKNTDKLCVFTSAGNMYQIKGMSLPRCKIKDKGVLIQTLCKLEKEEVVLYTGFETLFDSMLFFITKNGYVKLVSGTEFETIRSQIGATKLEAGDEVIRVQMLSGSDLLANDRRVFLLTKDGLSLAFLLEEVNELKRASRGVKGITLNPEDELVYGAVYAPDTTTVTFHHKKLHIGKLKTTRRCRKGQKNKL